MRQKKKTRRVRMLDESRFQSFLPNGGEEEIRTLDPHVANVMLYQLSYFPKWRKRCIVYQITGGGARGVPKDFQHLPEIQKRGTYDR